MTQHVFQGQLRTIIEPYRHGNTPNLYRTMFYTQDGPPLRVEVDLALLDRTNDYGPELGGPLVLEGVFTMAPWFDEPNRVSIRRVLKVSAIKPLEDLAACAIIRAQACERYQQAREKISQTLAQIAA